MVCMNNLSLKTWVNFLRE